MNALRTMPRRSKDMPGPPEQGVAVTIRFPADLRRRAIIVAQAEDRNFNSLVVYALRRYVTDQERGEAQAVSGK
jgi:predicted transcriptional regulator